MDVMLGVPPTDAERLSESATWHGHRVVARCDGADALTAALRTVAADAVLAAADEQHLTRRLVTACDTAGVRLVVVAATHAQVRHAAALGVLDVVRGAPEWTALEALPSAPETVGQAATAVPAAPVDSAVPHVPARGRVVVVWGPHGAPGRTALAVAIAAEAATLGISVALADADTHAASVAPSLGLLDEAPGFAAACRLAASGGLDAAEFDRIALTHRLPSSTFRVLTGLGRPGRWPELGHQRVTATLDAARDWVELLVVDVAAAFETDPDAAGSPDGSALQAELAPPARDAATAAALAAADQVVLVGAADPVGLSRLLRAHAALLELRDPSSVTVVVNRLRASAIGLNPAGQVRQTLERFGGIHDPVLVPHDVMAFDGALLGGVTLLEAAPRSPARSAVQRLVGERLLVQDAVARAG